MADTRERTVSYRRADWLIQDPDSINLGSCIKQASGKLKSIEERTIQRPNGQLMKLLSLKGYQEGHFLHITLETPGEAASVVPTVDKSVEETEISTAAPPVGTEFMDGDAFLFVKGNDVCLCTTSLHDSTVRSFLIDFFAKAKLRKDAKHFDLAKVASIPKVKLLQAQGVQEIELRASLYAATAHYLKRKAHPQGLLGSLAKQLKAVLGKENDANPDAMKAALTLKADRRRKGLALGEKRLVQIGIDTLKHQENGDDFTIVTKTGQRIGPNEIYMRTTVEMDAIGKSVVRDRAWKELHKFYAVLESSGALEE